MGPSPQRYIPSRMVIGPFVLKKIFERFLPYMGVVAIFVMTQTLRTSFCSPIPLTLHMKFGFDMPSSFGEEGLWKWWMMDGWRWTDNRPWLYYKLTNEPKGSGELKTKDGCQWPYLSTDWNHFRACTTRPPGEHCGQVKIWPVISEKMR